jgi:hypothetical protein
MRLSRTRGPIKIPKSILAEDTTQFSINIFALQFEAPPQLEARSIRRLNINVLLESGTYMTSRTRAWYSMNLKAIRIQNS